jgi:hypothetical protein
MTPLLEARHRRDPFDTRATGGPKDAVMPSVGRFTAKLRERVALAAREE